MINWNLYVKVLMSGKKTLDNKLNNLFWNIKDDPIKVKKSLDGQESINWKNW